MAGNITISTPPQQKVPVFTVLKNGAVLKNIFVVNDPPSPLSQSISALQDQKEEVLLVGRHPHCNIVLTHPSISRFHLQIFPDCSAYKIFVIDLSSVHGTWVSERKIEPGVRVELREGDTIRLGGSSRIYRLHWVPLDHAYNLEDSFLSKLDASVAEEKEIEEDKVIGEEVELGRYKEEPLVEIKRKHAQNLEDLLTSEDNVRQQEILCFDESKTKEVNTSDLRECDIEPLALSETSPMLDIPEESLYLSASNAEKKNSSDIVVDSFGSMLSESSPMLEHAIEPLAFSETSLMHGMLGESLYSNASNTEKKNSSDIVVGSIGSILLTECSPMLENMMSSVFEENSGLCIDLESPLRAPSEAAVKAYDQEKHSCIDISAEPSREDEISKVKLERDDQESYLAAAISEKKNSSDIMVGSIGSVLLTESSPMLENMMSSVFEENRGLCIDLESPLRAPSETAVKAYDQEKHSCIDISAEPSRVDEISKVKLECDDQESYLAAAISKDIDSCLGNENKARDDHCSKVLSQMSLPENHSKIRSQLPKEVKADNSIPQKWLSALSRNHGDAHEYKGNSSEDQTLCKDGQEGRDDFSVHQVTQSVISFMPFQEILCDQKLNIEEHNSRVFDEVNGTKSNLSSIWSRRGKPAMDLQLKTGKSKGKARSAVLDCKNQNSRENLENIPRTLFNGLEGEEEESFTPDKENITPKASKSAIKVGIHHPESFRDSILKPSSILGDCAEEEIYHSLDKENHTPRVLGERKKMKHISRNRSCLQEISRTKRPVESLPFNCLHASPGSQSKSTGYDASTRENLSVNCAKLNENQSSFSNNVFADQASSNWIMVVDTSSFLKKESWKSLQLLQGLKGTQLIIPRIVIRELNCLRQSFSLFRRTTKVSSILEWIEESMLNTKWWVHIQNSVEEGRSVAPTPPATPHQRLDDGSEDFPIIASNSARISSCVTIPSPTTEDHVLECALIFKKLKNNGKLVLLSNDVSLKIQAMAEGILCETAEEFRESLVNPLSDRFMWVDSSPRGRNWSFATDIPEEKYSRSPLKKSSRGHAARGLKLILLHNSHYGQITSYS